MYLSLQLWQDKGARPGKCSWDPRSFAGGNPCLQLHENLIEVSIDDFFKVRLPSVHISINKFSLNTEDIQIQIRITEIRILN